MEVPTGAGRNDGPGAITQWRLLLTLAKLSSRLVDILVSRRRTFIGPSTELWAADGSRRPPIHARR